MLNMERLQINFRLDKELAEKIDQRRIEMLQEMGKIPSRSEVLRIALNDYLSDSAKAKMGKTKK